MTDQPGVRVAPTRAILRALPLVIALALLAVVAFGTMHAILLKPIWRQLLGGVPFALAGAATATWCFTELRHGPWRSWSRTRAGLAFGVGAWVAMLPVTVAGVAFRLSGLHEANENLELVLEFALAALTGAALGWWLSRTWRGALAAATFVAVLLAVQAGPVPIGNGRRPTIVFLSLAVIYAMCGLGLAAIAGRALDRPSTRENPS